MTFSEEIAELKEEYNEKKNRGNIEEMERIMRRACFLRAQKSNVRILSNEDEDVIELANFIEEIYPDITSLRERIEKRKKRIAELQGDLNGLLDSNALEISEEPEQK